MKETITNIENQLLVIEAQDGNAESMELLVSRWQKKLWQYVFSLTSNSQVTWDITQQCWLDIIKNLKKLNDPENFKAWMYRIATNKSFDWFKRKNKYQHIQMDSMELADVENENDTDVKELVRRLNNKSRTILRLYYFEELNIFDISIVLNIPQGTVKSRLFKARQELKQLWEKYYND